MSSRSYWMQVVVFVVDVVLLHRHDSVHDPLDRRTAVALDVAPLAVDDIAFGDRGIEAHQPLLDHVLNLLDRNLVLRNRSGDLRRHTGDGLLLVRDAARTVGFRDGADDLLQRERLRLAITFDDGNLCVIHCNEYMCFTIGPVSPQDRTLLRGGRSSDSRRSADAFPLPAGNSGSRRVCGL